MRSLFDGQTIAQRVRDHSQNMVGALTVRPNIFHDFITPNIRFL